MTGRLPLVVLILAMLGAACAGTQSAGQVAEPLETVAAEEAASMTIAEVLRTDERFSRFRELAERTMTPVAPSWLDVWDWDASRMGDAREGVTVFVPTNAAFEALDPAVLAVLEDPEVDNPLLYAVLGHHYVHRLYPSETFVAGDQSTRRRSLSGPVQLTLDPLTWSGHPIEVVDLRTANGYIHVIGGVVVPDDVTAAAGG